MDAMASITEGGTAAIITPMPTIPTNDVSPPENIVFWFTLYNAQNAHKKRRKGGKNSD